MILFFDTSALVKFFHEEDGSEKVTKLIIKGTDLFIPWGHNKGDRFIYSFTPDCVCRGREFLFSSPICLLPFSVFRYADSGNFLLIV
jgi:hypothetical protein